MGFVTPALLGGAALVALPIVLHLIMRREPQRLVFPALRFVEQRRTMNQHRLRLRHLLLLALRCAIIALLAFALARPTLRGSGAAGKEGAPVAAALVFDNSLRMQYEHENKSRLEQSKELAAWLLTQIPADSPVTVVDRAGRQRGQNMDRDAAELRVERLDLSADVRPMGDALRDATHWLEDKRDYRGEIYVFTDLAAESWSADMLAELRNQLDALPGSNVYLIDVGAERPRNTGLGALRLSSEQLSPGGLLRLDTELVTIGATGGNEESGGERVVELYVGDGDSAPEKRGQQTVALNQERPGEIEFLLSGLGLGVHQGFVRIAGGDALPSDDVRYFTVDVQPPTKVLLLGESEDDTLFMREALAPTATIGLVQPKFACDVATYAQLESRPLADYGAICLVDPPPLPTAAWEALADFAEHGGGIGIFLGRHARRDEMNTAEAQKLSPAKLRWQSRDETYLRPVAVEHPAMGELRDLADVPWAEFPVFKYWELEAGATESNVIATFANGKPALVERQLGGGRVLMLTTSVSDPAHNDPWNLLPTGPDPWPFLALANGIVEYLAAAGETRLNHSAGQTVVLPLAPDEQVTSYVLRIPDGSALRQPLTPGQQDLSIAATETLGNYRVRAGGQQGRLDRGFSVNLPAELSRLERASAAEIVKALGKERTRVARTRGEIEIRVGLARTGRELFPALILALALVLAAETLLANRFYAGAGSGSKLGASRGVLAPDRDGGPPGSLPNSKAFTVGAGAESTR
ncbi:MAG: BatA domain-containing protein [Planctomycetes bacterium]|nr:BatA domain-containing protein [Planctomycetota bacterium]